ncbi:MAG: adenylosuccinate synthase [Thermoplasmata archaeon]
MGDVSVIVGAQFGDEAKGKITDFLAAGVRYVVRTGGGPNAGHTIHLPEAKVVLHQLACGVLRPGVAGISGPGMVIEPHQLIAEIRDLESRHLLKGEVIISERAHVLLTLHSLEDLWEEELRSGRNPKLALGTTGRGIGPAVSDRYGRWGIRFAELVRPEALKERLELLYASKEHLVDRPPFDELLSSLVEAGQQLAPYVRATEPLIWEAIDNDEGILLEGAQSALLDLDYGTYPYVTSSHPTSAGALVGSGIPPPELDGIIGVAKAYCTRVGAGPFPTEDVGEAGEFLRRVGDEHGATTGRPRRTGWLDLVMLRYAARLNGFTSLAVTKVDVLGGLDSVKVCTAYELPDGTRLSNYPPAIAEDLARVTPVYETLPGWTEFSHRLKERLHREGARALPPTLRRFLDHITAETEVPVDYVGFGPQRAETLVLPRGPFASTRRGVRIWPSG